MAIDHFIGYQAGLPEGLFDLRATLKAVMAAPPDAVTMHKGVAAGCWEPYAGRVPLIIQSTLGRPDDTADEHIVTVDEVLRLGAEAMAVCAFVRGKTEGAHLRRVAQCVKEAAGWELPVILHTYPRRFNPDGSVEISFAAEDIAWAVHCGVETGADIIKVPFTGQVKSYRDIVKTCPVPLVAAGGPKTGKLLAALKMAAAVMASGARGLTIGRNIWGTQDARQALAAFKAVIHDGVTPEKALRRANGKG